MKSGANSNDGVYHHFYELDGSELESQKQLHGQAFESDEQQ
jgi:hypothetical protein